MLSNDRIRFVSRAALDSYRSAIGTQGTMYSREQRADAWMAANPDAWSEIKPKPEAQAAAKERWSYRVEKPQPAAMNPVDSRPAHEGYDHFNFDVQHPALRR